MLRSLKKTGIRTPDGDTGFWVMEQKAGNVNWQEVNSLVRPGVLRMFTYQLVSRGATGDAVFPLAPAALRHRKISRRRPAAQPRSGSRRVFKEIAQIGEELKLLAPALKDTKVSAEACILYSHDNDWALQQPNQPNKYFSLREHIQLIYNALHDRNILVDFARPTEDLSKYKIVFAPSLHLLSGGEADRLKLYVQNGGTLDRHLQHRPGGRTQHRARHRFSARPDRFVRPRSAGVRHAAAERGKSSHLQGRVPDQPHASGADSGATSSSRRAARFWRPIAKDFYAGKPAITMNTFGLGKAIYIGTQSHQHFYHDLVAWLRQMSGLHPLLKVPENIEVSMREKEGSRVLFPAQPPELPRAHPVLQADARFPHRPEHRRQLRPSAARRAGH